MKTHTSVSIGIQIVATTALIGMMMGGTNAMFRKSEERIRNHLERKYHEQFLFVDHPVAEIGDDIQISLSCESFPGEIITAQMVYVEGHRVYRDNYMAFYWKECVMELVCEAAEKAFLTECKVFGWTSPIALLDDEIGFDSRMEEYTATPDSSLRFAVFANGAAIDELSLERFRAELQKRRIVLEATVVSVAQNAWNDVTEADANFMDFTTGKFVSYATFKMDADYRIVSFEWDTSTV